MARLERGTPRLGLVLLVVLVLAAASSPAARAQIEAPSRFPRRFRSAGGGCSLRARARGGPAERSCVLESALGSDAQGRLLLAHGERNCTVALRGCKALCYGALDAAHLGSGFVADAAPARRGGRSFFSELAVESGGDLRVWGGDGFSFDAAGSGADVVLRYSTHTCAAYYAGRGREEAPRCGAPKAALTPLQHGVMPIDSSLC